MAQLLYQNQFVTTSLSVVGGIDASQTTGIVIQSTTGIDTTKPGIALIEYSDPLTGDYEWIEYTAINSTTNTFTGVTRGAEGSTGKSHDNSVTVAFPVSESHMNRLADALSIEGDPTNGIDGVKDEDDMASDSATHLSTQQAIKAYVDARPVKSNLFENAIINGNFDVWQRATAFSSTTTPANNDDTYLIDRWNLVSDGNDVVDISRDTDAPDGSKYSAKFDVETSAQFGIVQILENVETEKLNDKSVSLSFAVKSANISALRAAVLTWAGTADAPTSDVVGTWAATPTWAANWTAENTPSDLTVTSSWTTVKIENIAVDSATVNNLAVVIWTPSAETIGDIVYISQVQLNEGATAKAFEPKPLSEELTSCQRFYNKSYNYDVNPGTASTRGMVSFLMSDNNNSKFVIGYTTFPVTMRDNPSVTLYDRDGTSGKITTLNAAGSATNNVTPTTGAESAFIGTTGFRVVHNGTVAGLEFQYSASAEL